MSALLDILFPLAVCGVFACLGLILDKLGAIGRG